MEVDDERHGEQGHFLEGGWLKGAKQGSSNLSCWLGPVTGSSELEC